VSPRTGNTSAGSTELGIIGLDLFQKCEEALASKSLGHQTNVKIIKLIPKVSNRKTIGGLRSITLLNVACKVLAKALARRLEVM